MCPVDLVESPEKVLCGAIDIVAPRIVWEVVAEGRPGELGLEQVDLV